VLSLAKEYLPSESQDALMKAEAPIGDFLEQLRTLAKEAGTGTELEAPASDAAAAPTDAATTEASAPAPASDQVGASSAPAQGEAAASTESVPQADGAEKAATTTVKKSLYTVRELADVLTTVRYMAIGRRVREGVGEGRQPDPREAARLAH
jgi:hypothetical protein